jgi:hypothetical protein
MKQAAILDTNCKNKVKGGGGGEGECNQWSAAEDGEANQKTGFKLSKEEEALFDDDDLEDDDELDDDDEMLDELEAKLAGAHV